MKKFNIEDYDQVEDRIKKFYAEHQDGRITTKVIFQDGNRTMIKAYVYLSLEEQEKKCPKATGIAEEERVGIQKTKTGSEYEPVNFSSWTENCETSAIGRALANMNMSGNKRPSRQEMEKVQRYSQNTTQKTTQGTKKTGYLPMASESQVKYGKQLGIDVSKMTVAEASRAINESLKENGAPREELY